MRGARGGKRRRSRPVAGRRLALSTTGPGSLVLCPPSPVERWTPVVLVVPYGTSEDLRPSEKSPYLGYGVRLGPSGQGGTPETPGTTEETRLESREGVHRLVQPSQSFGPVPSPCTILSTEQVTRTESSVIPSTRHSGVSTRVPPRSSSSRGKGRHGGDGQVCHAHYVERG